MIQPLALVLYEKLLPGTQLVNRLHDLNYRVQALNEAGLLVGTAEQIKPMLVIADLDSTKSDVCQVIGLLRQNPNTGHLPVLGFARELNAVLEETARKSGVTLLVGEAAVLGHLPQLLDRVLQLE